MAKWGEGDPRWLVQHRDDGKNVNGWHWEEKNKLEWSRQRIGELLQPVVTQPIHELGAAVSLVEVKEVTGEAVVSTRKGNKRCCLYDLKITLKWEGEEAASPATSTEKVKGELRIEEFASHSDPDDYVFTTTVEGTGALQDKCKTLALKFKPAIVEQLQKYITDFTALQ